MATQMRYLSGTGVMPSASGQVIFYIRKPADFVINEYAQFIESPTTNGMYAFIDPDQPVRIVNEAEFAFEDGDARPEGNYNQLAFQWVPFRVYRRDYPFKLGDQAIELAKKFNKFDPVTQHSMMVASQAMTNRTNRVIKLMETVANWGANTADANVINGGYGNWKNASSDPTSPFFLAIKRSIGNAMKIINLNTNGRVRRRDMKLVISPGLAEFMADTSEVYDYVKFSTRAEAIQSGEGRDYSEDWGLPKKLYGVEVVVEETMLVNTYPIDPPTLASSTTGDRKYAKSDTSAVLVSRVGGIEGAYGSPSFSTIQIYFYGAPMQVYTFNDKENKRTKGHVEEAFIEVLAAPASGFLITACA